MDRPIAKSERRRAFIKRWGRILLLVLSIVAIFFLLRQWLQPSVKRTEFRFARVETGDIENTITASGLVVPAFEEQVNAPIATQIKATYRRNGDEVEAGERIMDLNPEFIQLEFESLQDGLELKSNEIIRLKLEYDKNLRDLDYEDSIKALQLSSLEALLADARRLKTIGSATQEEVDQAELSLKIARLEKKKLENDLAFRREVINADKRKLELETLIQEKKIAELERKLNLTSVKAPRRGVITWISEDIGKQVAEGEPLVRLADLGNFRIEASCSDRYAPQVRIGMPVRVRINNTRLDATVTSILPAVANNTLSFIVELENPAHQELRPNLRVEAYLVSEGRTNVLRVPNGPAFTGAVEQDIFVVRDQVAIKEKVRIGLTNMDYVEILEGNLRPGDIIILSDMADYDHLDRIELK